MMTQQISQGHGNKCPAEFPDIIAERPSRKRNAGLEMVYKGFYREVGTYCT